LYRYNSAWLTEGRGLIEAVLKDKDEVAGLPVSMTGGRFSWVHFPASAAGTTKAEGEDGQEGDGEDEEGGVEHVRHSGAPNCETVAVVFQRHDDLERWRMSRRRAAWLDGGARFNGDAGNDGNGGGGGNGKGGGGGDGSGVLTARATAINVDDGSLGGWLPADPDAPGASAPGRGASSPMPSWKVYTAVRGCVCSLHSTLPGPGVSLDWVYGQYNGACHPLAFRPCALLGFSLHTPGGGGCYSIGYTDPIMALVKSGYYPTAPYAAVVLAQYPLYELNALVLLPALDAAAAAGLAHGGGLYYYPAMLFAGAPQAARGLAVAAWTAVGAVFVTLPLAQRQGWIYHFSPRYIAV
jgi:hypothetical protein